METEYLLSMNDISKEYFGNKVLKNVNLQVKAGKLSHGRKRCRQIDIDECVIWHARHT